MNRIGYEAGKNLVIESRFAEGKPERLDQFAAELVRLNVELIVALVNSASDAARRASQTIPIVMYANMFPVERGLAASLARPGGNVTGTVWWAQPTETVLKIFQVVKDAVPTAKHAVAIFDPSEPQSRLNDERDHQRRLAAIGLTLTRFAMTRREDLETVFAQVKANRPDMPYVSGAGGAVGSHHREIAGSLSSESWCRSQMFLRISAQAACSFTGRT